MTEAEWMKREANLLYQIDEECKRYWGYAEKARKKGRTTNVISLFCSVLAPVMVVSSSSSFSVLGIPPSVLAAVSIVLTIVLSFTEGLRRIFSFELRWAGAITALASIKQQRERYLDGRIGTKIGSAKWVANFRAARAAVENAAINETSEYFKGVLSQIKKDDKT